MADAGNKVGEHRPSGPAPRDRIVIGGSAGSLDTLLGDRTSLSRRLFRNDLCRRAYRARPQQPARPTPESRQTLGLASSRKGAGQKRPHLCGSSRPPSDDRGRQGVPIPGAT
jgi:hypothetical protein